jgi:hypothetical protein
MLRQLGAPGGPAALLELQRPVSNAAVAAKMVQRAVGPGLAAQELPPPTGADPVIDIASEIIIAAGPLAGTPQARGMWDMIRRQFTSRQASSGKASQETGPVAAFKNLLYSKSLASRINRLKKPQKQKALEHIFSALAGAADVKAEQAGGEPSLSTPPEEFEQLQPTKFGDFIKSETKYRGIRSGLLGAFGALEVGMPGALKNAETYYASMVRIETFIGKRLAWPCYVHPEMAKAIHRAEVRLFGMRDAKVSGTNPGAANGWFAGLTNSIKNFGDGVEIRPNANNPMELSLHSYGWAIDVNASFNPNVPGFPRDLVKEMTGVDVFTGSTGQTQGNFARGKSSDDVRKEAERLRDASGKFTGAFESESSLKAAMLGIINDRLGANWAIPEIDGVYPLVIAAVDAGKDKNKSQRDAARASSRDALMDHLRVLQDSVGPSTPIRAGEFQRLNLATTLIQLGDIYKQSYTGKVNKKTGQPERVKDEARVTNIATIAAHGFMNLDPDVVGALAGSDAGQLKWLGAVDESNTKDFMHFELAERPALY